MVGVSYFKKKLAREKFGGEGELSRICFSYSSGTCIQIYEIHIGEIFFIFE